MQFVNLKELSKSVRHYLHEVSKLYKTVKGCQELSALGHSTIQSSQ